jgi:hypothetical protein
MKTQDFENRLDEMINDKNKAKTLLILLISISLILLFYYVGTKLNEKKEIILNKENQQILKKNKVLDSLNATYLLNIKKKDSVISKLVNQDNLLKNKVLSIDSKIKAINYEKANSHSDNFSSEQLKRYFADSLR